MKNRYTKLIASLAAVMAADALIADESSTNAMTEDAIAAKELILNSPAPRSNAELAQAKKSSTMQSSSSSSKQAPMMEQSYPLTKEQMSKAYNAPGRIKTSMSWDAWINGSFIWWFVDEEGLELAVSAVDAPPTTPTAPVSLEAFLPDHTTVLYQPFRFKPGFKVGLGLNFNYDGWTGYAGYTWMHQSTSLISDAPSQPGGIGTWYSGSWYLQATPLDQYVSSTQVTSKWHLQTDLLEVYLSRPFYEGRALTISPFAGLEAAWIRQQLRIKSNVISTTVPNDPVVSFTQSKAWALGPKGGMQGHWHMGWGFRLEGDFAGALLFTRYYKTHHREDPTEASDPAAGFTASMPNYNCLRPMAEMGLGLGWGSYFSNQSYHFDLLVNYDFMILWEQNMMRKLMDEIAVGTDASAGDLHMNGLTVTARFDF